jgi:glutathione peroxidase
MNKSIYEYQVPTSSDDTKEMKDYAGKVLLIVNTASKCGFTKQYAGIEKLYEDYEKDGFEVLGFPCNQFGGQEPGDQTEINEFCTLNFNIKFPIFKKIDVNGNDALPLYEFLKTKAPGLLGSKAIKWNFTKFLVDRDGNVLKRFAPKDEPEKMRSDIITALKK